MAHPELKLYRGFVNDTELVVSGHVFRDYPNSKKLYTREGVRNIKSIVALFTIETFPNVRVVFELGNIRAEMSTEPDGFFRFTLPIQSRFAPGWHRYRVRAYLPIAGQTVEITCEGEFLAPDHSAYIIVSDIDDTFLISYTRKPLKKLYVLLVKNVAARKSHVDVIRHYRLLETAGNGNTGRKNPFFYVSSSEWNLYDYLLRYTELQELPKAVIKLKRIKEGLRDFLATGRGRHDHKYRKIANIIRSFPDRAFILLGDDSQMDPAIYHRLANEFPNNIQYIYIRQTRILPKNTVVQMQSLLKMKGIAVCYFLQSQEAIQHSIDFGIIQTS